MFAAHEPEQRATDKYDHTGNDYPPLSKQPHRLFNEARLRARGCTNDISGRFFYRCGFCIVRCVGSLVDSTVVDRRVVIGDHFTIVNNRFVDGRLINFATNTGKLFSQRREFVVANFDQRLLLRYVGTLKLADALLYLLFTRRQLWLVVAGLAIRAVDVA